MIPSRTRTAPSSTTDARPWSTPVITYRPRTSAVPMAGARRRGGGSGPDGRGLRDAAPDRAAPDAAPERLESVRQGAAVGRGQHEAEQQAVTARGTGGL